MWIYRYIGKYYPGRKVRVSMRCNDGGYIIEDGTIVGTVYHGKYEVILNDAYFRTILQIPEHMMVVEDVDI